MKNKNEELEVFWASPNQVEKLREELRKRMDRDELESGWRLDVVHQLVSALEITLVEFKQLWLQPLLSEGLNLDRAICLIAQLHFRPS